MIKVIAKYRAKRVEKALKFGLCELCRKPLHIAPPVYSNSPPGFTARGYHDRCLRKVLWQGTSPFAWCRRLVGHMLRKDKL